MPEPYPHAPARPKRVAPGTLVALVQSGRVVAVRSAPRGPVVARLGARWTGGDRLAIHGGSTAGSISTGCLHAAEADLRYLMRAVPLGTQITIHP